MTYKSTFLLGTRPESAIVAIWPVANRDPSLRNPLGKVSSVSVATHFMLGEPLHRKRVVTEKLWSNQLLGTFPYCNLN
jgi:hypothetical protein